MEPRALQDEITALADHLGMSSKQVQSLRLKMAKQHGDECDPKLRDHLAGIAEQCKDEPRLLRQLPPSDPSAGPSILGAADVVEAAEVSAYTNNSYQAMPLEPEAVPAHVQRRYTAEAHARAATTPHAHKREARSIAQQVRQATAEAHRKGADVTPHLAKIRTELDAMRRAP